MHDDEHRARLKEFADPDRAYARGQQVGQGPMPEFTFKASDALAYPILVSYARACREFGLEQQAQKVAEAAEDFRSWQNYNTKQTHLPDFNQ